MATEPHDLLPLALDIARGAADPILDRFLAVSSERKPDGSEVTEADRAAERYVRARLEREQPHADVLGEEYGGPDAPTQGDLWIVDPIDGTRSFVTGNPLFGTLLGLLRDGEPVLGVAHLPALGETLYAARGAGCWRVTHNEAPTRCRVRDTPLERAYLGTTHPDGTDLRPGGEPDPIHLGRLLDVSGGTRWGGDLYAHLLVARGGLQLALDPVMKPWDIAALVPIVREAGGVATSRRGDHDCVFSGSLFTGSSPTLLDEARRHLGC